MTDEGDGARTSAGGTAVKDAHVGEDRSDSAEVVDQSSSAEVVDRSGFAAVVDRLTAPRFDLSTRIWQALVLVTVVGIVARLVALGARPAHFDEGRVAFWTLRYAETGHFEYRYIIHGPFVQHVNATLFPLLGATDFVMRLPVALIGGLFPLSAVLFRDYLRDEEVLALALFLALNPILLYYSRFFRSDVPVAAFMFVAFGFLVRLVATRRMRYLHAATVFAALGFASKENAVVYLLCWVGAGVLVADTALFRPRQYDTALARLAAARDRVLASVRGSPARARRISLRAGGHLALTVGLFAAVTLFMYAPRAGEAGGVGLWVAVVEPSQFPAVVDATLADLEVGFDYWFGRSSDPACFEESVIGGYICYLGRFLATMGKYAAPLSLLAVGGFLWERYARADTRPLVMFASYWGFASVLGYPLGTDIWGAWIVTHAAVPLAIPAAVGLGAVLVRGRPALSAGQANNGRRASDGRRDAGVVGLIVLLVVSGMVVPGVGAAFVDDDRRESTSDMVQYAQPSDDLRPALSAMDEAIDEGDLVVFYGQRYYLADESVTRLPPAADPNNDTGPWFNRLPLPWYTEAFGAEVTSARTPLGLSSALADDPAVVVAGSTGASDVRSMLSGEYRVFEADLRAHLDGPSGQTSVVIFVDESRLSTDERGVRVTTNGRIH